MPYRLTANPVRDANDFSDLADFHEKRSAVFTTKTVLNISGYIRTILAILHPWIV